MFRICSQVAKSPNFRCYDLEGTHFCPCLWERRKRREKSERGGGETTITWWNRRLVPSLSSSSFGLSENTRTQREPTDDGQVIESGMWAEGGGRSYPLQGTKGAAAAAAAVVVGPLGSNQPQQRQHRAHFYSLCDLTPSPLQIGMKGGIIKLDFQDILYFPL